MKALKAQHSKQSPKFSTNTKANLQAQAVNQLGKQFETSPAPVVHLGWPWEIARPHKTGLKGLGNTYGCDQKNGVPQKNVWEDRTKMKTHNLWSLPGFEYGYGQTQPQ